MSLRKVVFWVHLASGVIAGLVVAVMSATGVAIAFEEEILAWVDRDVRRIAPAAPGATPLSFDQLLERAAVEKPELKVTRIVRVRDGDRAWELFAGREGPVYVNPFTGELRESQAHATHDLIHELEEWHRWLGMSGKGLAVGKLITGVCNLAFVVLCLTGLYLWFPRQWSRRMLRPRLWFTGARGGKARDFNHHHVFGFWALPVLVVLAVTAVVISFEWGHRLVFTLAGEEAPKSRNFGMMAVPPAQVPAPGPGVERLPLDTVVERVAAEFPDWRSIGVGLPRVADEEPATPLKLDVTLPDYMPSRAYVPVEADPFTGAVLQAVRFQDRSAGLQARVWIRFLHTGAGLGVFGKIVASIASVAAVVLVYTGMALSWRRMRARRGT